MDLFNQFINQCATECVNASKVCPRCLREQIPLDTDVCFTCHEDQMNREARNDSGV